MDVLRINVFITIVDQYYNIEVCNNVKNINDITNNIIIKLKKIEVINDMFTNEQLKFSVISIINTIKRRKRQQVEYLKSLKKK